MVSPTNSYQVVECGVHLLYDGGEFGLRLLRANDEDKIQHFHLIMSDSSHFYPLGRDELEARFQANRWEDYSVMHWTSEFLADSLLDFRISSKELYHDVCFLNL
jgi:hypothetical protein